MLQPLCAGKVNKKDFQVSVPYKVLLYKTCCQGFKWKLQLKDSISVSRLVTGASLEIGAVSHIIDELSSFHFAGPRPIHSY